MLSLEMAKLPRVSGSGSTGAPRAETSSASSGGLRGKMLPRPRRRESLAAPETSSELMGTVLARLGGQGRAREFRVFDCYARVVGEILRARTAPERLAGATLYVRVASSALAHEVTVLRGDILAKMTAELGIGVVTELRTRVGGSNVHADR
jgi:hypothetical protein